MSGLEKRISAMGVTARAAAGAQDVAQAVCEAEGIAYSEHASFRASLRDSVSYLHSLSR
jgi:hypothetical protein